MIKRTNRRRFIGAGAAVGIGYWAGTSPVVRAQPSALQGLSAACIGVGGKGKFDSRHIAEHGVQIAALCDVDSRMLHERGREFPSAERYDDFRAMLDQVGDKVDIVTVSTPDHTHATAAARAMRMKKHVYCQKPLTWSISEARLLRQTAEAMGVVTQMGNQGTSENGLRTAVEVIQSGAIGDVSEVHVWSNRPTWPQGMGRPVLEDPIPEDLNWDAWIGPAPMRPFKKGAYHRFKWRGWVDFGTGALGDMACHLMNMPVMALKLWDPVAVTAIKNPGIFQGETYPASSILRFEFPQRDGFSACNLYWYDGGELPRQDLIRRLPASFQERVAKQRSGGVGTSGALIVGSNAMVFAENDYGSKIVMLPEEKFADFKRPEPWLPRIPYNSGLDERQKWEFVSTVRGEYEPGTMSNFGYAGRLTETILVGNLALRAGQGQRIEWDAQNLRSPNVPAVNEFVARQYRDGWQV